MADPRWMGPPEVVAAIFEAGPGPASVLANQLVWIVETINHELAIGLSAANTATTAAQWVGLGGGASACSAAALNGALQTLVGWITHKVAVTQAAADAYLMAASAVVPALVSQTNRDETVALHATNFLGMNTPAIIERDTEYFGEHWPHNSSVGATYSSVLTGLVGTLGVPPPAATPGASVAAPAAAVQAAGQSSGEVAGQGVMKSAGAAVQLPARAASAPGEAGSALQPATQLMTALTGSAGSVTGAPTQVLQGFSSAPQALMSTFSALRPTAPPGPGGVPAGAVAEPFRSGGTAGVGGAAGGVGGYPAAALTSYTRPASTFTPEHAGRPGGRAGVLNAAELRGPTGGGIGGTPMPMTPAAGMLNRGATGGDRDGVNRAHIVVGAGKT